MMVCIFHTFFDSISSRSGPSCSCNIGRIQPIYCPLPVQTALVTPQQRSRMSHCSPQPTKISYCPRGKSSKNTAVSSLVKNRSRSRSPPCIANPTFCAFSNPYPFFTEYASFSHRTVMGRRHRRSSSGNRFSSQPMPKK